MGWGSYIRHARRLMFGALASPLPTITHLGGGRVPIPLASLFGSLGRMALAGAGFTLGQKALGAIFGKEEDVEKLRRRKGIVVVDQEGNIVGYISERRRRRARRLPKPAYEALKAQQKLVEKVTDFINVLMFKEMAEKTR